MPPFVTTAHIYSAYFERNLGLLWMVPTNTKWNTFTHSMAIMESKAPVSQLVNADDTSVIEIKTQQVIPYTLNKVILMCQLKKIHVFFLSVQSSCRHFTN